MIRKTIAATLMVASTAVVIDLKVNDRNRKARIITPKTPEAAASVGVAMPKMMNPITMKTTRLIGKMLVQTSFILVSGLI